MNKIITYDVKLIDECEKTSYASVARRIGVTKDAVRQMVNSGREIYLRLGKSGHLEYCEYCEYKRGHAKYDADGRLLKKARAEAVKKGRKTKKRASALTSNKS